MSASPEFPVPTWATDDVWTSGPDVGQPTKLTPVAGLVSQGWLRGLKPPADWMNWVLNALCGWVGYTARVAALNFKGTYADSSATPFDTTNTRGDGTAAAFWDYGTSKWVLLGSNTAGSYYTGDDGTYAKVSTSGVSSPPKYTWGCSSQGHIIMGDSTRLTGATSGPVYAQSNTPATTFTKLNLAGTFTFDVQATDAIDLAGTAIVVGAGDGNFLAWTSTDGGATTTKRIVGTRVDALTPLSRIMVGAAGRVFAWANAVAINGGDKLWYSDDGGATWASTGSIGFDTIVGGAYLAGPGLYMFATGSSIMITSDPTSLSFTTVAAGFPVDGIWGADYWAWAGVRQSAGIHVLFMSDDQFATPRLVKRDLSDNAITIFATENDSGGAAQRILARSTLANHVSLRW